MVDGDTEITIDIRCPHVEWTHGVVLQLQKPSRMGELLTPFLEGLLGPGEKQIISSTKGWETMVTSLDHVVHFHLQLRHRSDSHRNVLEEQEKKDGE